MFNVKLTDTSALKPAFGYEMEGSIKLPKLRALLEADLVGDTVITGQRGGWTIGVHLGPEEPVLLAGATGTVRVFTTADSAIHQLIRLGITRFEVIADKYESGTLRASRPDRAEVLRQGAEYDRWVKDRVATVRSRLADGSETMLSTEESRAVFQKMHSDLRKKR